METHKLTDADRQALSAGGGVSDEMSVILEAAFCDGYTATEDACIAYNTTDATPTFPPAAVLPDRIDCGNEDDTELLHSVRLREFGEGAQSCIVRSIEEAMTRNDLADRLRVCEAVRDAALRELDGNQEAEERIRDVAEREEAAIEEEDRARGEETAAERAKRAGTLRDVRQTCRDLLDALHAGAVVGGNEFQAVSVVPADSEQDGKATMALIRLEGMFPPSEPPTDDDVAAARSEEHEPDAPHAEADREIAAATAAEAAGVPGAELRLARAVEGKKQCG